MPQIYGGPPSPAFDRPEADAWDGSEVTVLIDTRHSGSDRRSVMPTWEVRVTVWASDICVIADKHMKGIGNGNQESFRTPEVDLGHRLQVLCMTTGAHLHVKPCVNGVPLFEVAFSDDPTSAPGGLFMKHAINFRMTVDPGRCRRLVGLVRLQDRPFRASELGGA